jgi:hypothetical protein
VQENTMNLRAWSISSIASDCDEEEWLETASDGHASVNDVELDSLQNNFGEPVRSVRQEEGKNLGGEGRNLAHQSRQNRTETVAEAADSDEVFLGVGGSSGEREKRGEGGAAGGFVGAAT